MHKNNNFKNKSQKCINILSLLENINIGLYSCNKYKHRLKQYFEATHELSENTIDKGNGGIQSYVASADIDPIENRYILTGRSSGGLTINDAYITKKSISLVGRVKGGVPGTHNGSITCVQWYPVDAGLFSSSSNDSCIKIWDPNILKVVEEFVLESEITNHCMSPIASKHSLLAAASVQGEVILCDLRSGSATHRLHGHTDSVTFVQWALHNPNILASGGKDKTIRLWDVRSSRSCIKILDSGNASKSNYKYRKRKKSIPTAHSHRINSLCFTNDGLFLLSLSPDGQLNVWHTSSGQNLNVKFGDEKYATMNTSVKMAVTYNNYQDLVFVPCKNSIFVYEIMSGALVNVLNAHLASVSGVCYNSRTQDLYSYSNDNNFLIWTPKQLQSKEDHFNSSNASDDWSSDGG